MLSNIFEIVFQEVSVYIPWRMVSLQLTFGAGVYAGIYITQNYEVPRVDEPSKLWEKVKEWAESHKKKD